MRWIIPLLATASIVAVTLPAVAQAAPMAAKPSANFSFVINKVNQGVKPRFSYSVKNEPRGSEIYLQRQFGSAHTWENVEHLKAASGTTTAPAVRIGPYVYRIRLSTGKKTVTTSRAENLYSYGKITMQDLCDTLIGGSTCDPRTVQIGDQAFNFIFWPGTYAYPTWVQVFQFTKTSCRQISVRFATNGSTNGDRAYTQVVQSGTKPTQSSSPTGVIGTMNVSLNGGPYILNGSTSSDGIEYFNGSALCYTATGLR
jgi:hypothetical protein